MNYPIRTESNYSDYEDDDDLLTIKKFLNTISEPIYSDPKDQYWL